MLARAVLLRAWLHAAVASLMLAVVTVVSLASGTGFAALTRGSAVASREAQAERLAAARRDLADVTARIEQLVPGRSVKSINAELQSVFADWRWQNSNSCIETKSASVRQFCSGAHKLMADLEAAVDFERLTAERSATRARVEALQAAGAGIDSDPQAGAIAELLGVDRKLPRLLLTTSIAVVLELGSVLLVLLVAGPALHGWREPGTEPEAPPAPAELPAQADRSHWRRQRDKANLDAVHQAGHHAR